MNQLGPLLLNYVEQQARPHVETKVTEQLNDTKGDLKSDLPSTIMSFLTGKDGSGEGTNPMVSQIISQLGPNFMNRLTSVTNMTVDTSSEGMDTLLTNGVINTAKNVLTQQSTAANGGAPETGGIDFDFFKNGKEGMVNSAMTASMPIIKQVSENMGNKMSSSFPAAIGGAIQQLIDENGSANGALGTAAGLMSKFMGSHGPGDQPVNGGGDAGDVHATGGQTGGIQQLFQNLLSPKILLLLQPYLQKFEVQMTATLEKELRDEVFSPEYIKQAVMGTLTGEGGQDGGGAGAALGNVFNTFSHGGGQNSQNGQQSSTQQAIGAIGSFASSFLKKEDK